MAPRLIASVFFVFLSIPAFADTLTGKVVKITDGDTLYVLDANYREHKIRLAGIDAPERKQAYGLASRKHLASIVAGKQVTVEYQKRDRYGRIVGKVLLDGIDAPERKQAYGLASRKRLASMVAGQLITPTRASETNGCVRISLSPAFYRPYVVPLIHLTVLNNCEPPL